MNLIDYLKMAFANIRAAKLRSLLTSLGIIIGVGSVVLIMSISSGVSDAITGSFSDLGSTRMSISPSTPRETTQTGPGGRLGGGGGANPLGNVGIASTLTADDAAALTSVDGVAASAPVVLAAAKVSGPSGSLNMGVTGTTPDFQNATGQTLVEGRMFAAGASEAVLNQSAANSLFGSASAVGQSVQVNNASYTVVGILQDEQSPFRVVRRGSNGDAAPAATPVLLMPVEPALKLAGTEHVSQIVIDATSPEVVDATIDRISAALLARHNGVQDFSISSFQQLMTSFTQIFDTLTVFLAAIAGISLLVGGIGIMNIMLVTVSERTREIGIAKAIGATRRNVVIQFLTEAVTLSLIGGILGLAVAWLGSVLLNRLFSLPAQVSLTAIALAVGVSAAIGIFFGVVPAWRAARLDPIVALRHE